MYYYKKSLVILTILIFLLSSLCGENILYVSGNLKKREIWYRILTNNPPKFKIEYLNKSQNTKHIKENFLTVKDASWHTPSSIKPTTATKTGIYTKKIAEERFLPVVKIYDSRNSISLKELQSIFSKGKERKNAAVRLISLETINRLKNEKVLLVNGKDVLDPYYPLIETTYLQLQSSNTDIIKWFSKTKEIAPQTDKTHWILAVGDIMLARGVDRLLLQENGKERVFGNTTKQFKAGKLLLGNLECVASLSGERLKEKTYTFHFNPRALQPLREMGFSYLSITNNHSFDFGINGFLHTLKNLDTYNIGYSGAGKNLPEASTPWKIDLGGLTIKILSAGFYPIERMGFSGLNYLAQENRPGILWLNKYFFNLIEKEYQSPTLNIAMIHGGVEWTTMPTKKQVKYYRKLIEKGTSIVIGSHPHFIQGIERYKGGLIAYSLGNFLFPGMEETGLGDKSIILKIGIADSYPLYIIPIPVELKGKSVRITQNVEIIKHFYGLTKRIEKDFTNTKN